MHGTFCRRRPHGMSVLKQLLLRLWLLTIGRFHANLTRTIIQRLAITGKPRTRWRFRRTIEVEAHRVVVSDHLPASMPLGRLSVGSDATSIYVANSLVYQESVLCPWQHVDPATLPVVADERVWRRVYYRGSGHDPEGSRELQT